jgi:hypothetical protein
MPICVCASALCKSGQLVDLSSHNANPPGGFDGEAVPLSDLADTRIDESVAALREFIAEHGSLPTAESWTEAAMRPSEKTNPAPIRQVPRGDPARRADLTLCGTRGARTGRANSTISGNSTSAAAGSRGSASSSPSGCPGCAVGCNWSRLRCRIDPHQTRNVQGEGRTDRFSRCLLPPRGQTRRRAPLPAHDREVQALTGASPRGF